MTSLEHELRLMKQKVDLLIDGYQVLYMKIDQQNRLLRRIEAEMVEDVAHGEVLYDETVEQEHKVVRMSDRFLERVRKNLNDRTPFDPDDKTLA